MKVLVGMTATGKTSLGEFAAKKHSLCFVDLDEMIEDVLQIDIAREIFNIGPARLLRFTELQLSGLRREVEARQPDILAVGGLFPTSKAWRQSIRGFGRERIWLRASSEIIAKRMGLDGALHRANMLAVGESPAAQISTLLRFRNPMYRSVSTSSVDTDGLTISETCVRVVQ